MLSLLFKKNSRRRRCLLPVIAKVLIWGNINHVEFTAPHNKCTAFKHNNGSMRIGTQLLFVSVRIKSRPHWGATLQLRIKEVKVACERWSFSAAHNVIKTAVLWFSILKMSAAADAVLIATGCCAGTAAGRHDTNYHQGKWPSHPQPCCSRVPAHCTPSQCFSAKRLRFTPSGPA